VRPVSAMPSTRTQRSAGVRGAEKGKEEAEKAAENRPKVALFTPQKSVKLLVEVIAREIEDVGAAEDKGTPTTSAQQRKLKGRLQELLTKCVNSEAASEGAGKALWAMSDARRRLMIMTVSELEPSLGQYLLTQLKVTKHVAEFHSWSRHVADVAVGV